MLSYFFCDLRKPIPGHPSILMHFGDAQNDIGFSLAGWQPWHRLPRYMRGPLTVSGSGKPLSAEELAACKEELEAIKKERNVRRMVLSPLTGWCFGT